MVRQVNVKNPLLVVLAVLFLANAVSAGESAGQPGEFLRYGIGARPLAMGGAFVGLADDINSIYYNPAGLKFLTGLEASFMCSRFWQGISYQYIAVGLPDVKYGLALGVAHIRHDMEAFDLRTATDDSIGSFDITEHATYLSLAWSTFSWPAELSVGGTAKFVFQNFRDCDDGSSGPGADLGVIFRYSSFFRKKVIPVQVGMCIQNLLKPKLRTELSDESLPTALDMGGSASYVYEKVTLTAAVSWHLVESQEGGLFAGRKGVNLGSEAIWRVNSDISAAFRVGRRSDPGSLTIGGGLCINLDGSLVGINVGSRTHKYDFARPDFGDDELTFRPSFARRDAEYYYGRLCSVTDDSLLARQYAIKIVRLYPNEFMLQAAAGLVYLYDRSHASRYLRFLEDMAIKCPE